MLRLSLLSLPLVLLSHSACATLLGWVESPGYPNGYQPHASLNWSRCAPKGHTLSIRLIHLDLEDSPSCDNDGVKIYSNGNLISLLCGKREFEELQSTVNPLLISSPGGCLSLFFHSDYSNTRRYTGFRGFYTVQDFDECDDPENGCTQFCHNFIGGYRCSCRHGYHLAEDKHVCTVSCDKDLSGLQRGHIASPSWPGPYAENANCQYTLSVDAHLQLELVFSGVFDVEQGPEGQCIDTLTIETHSGSLGPFCGHTPPPSPLLTHSHHVKIRFTSDGFGTNKGFSFHFQIRGKVCPAVVTSHSTVVPEKPEHHPGQIVTVTCELGYILKIQGTQTLETKYEATCLITGQWLPNNPCEPVNCGRPNIPDNSILQLVDSSDTSRTHYNDQIQFSCSSKYYTLEGEDTYTCSASGEWVSSAGEKTLPKCIPVCGMPDVESISTARILGGEDAKIGEIPWQILIKRRGGASLINDQWAVTAAHVVEGLKEPSLQMYGGLANRNTILQRPSDVVSLQGERIIIHPGYRKGIPDEDRTDYDNDIALIRLSSRVNLGPKILPICLPESNSVLEDNEQGSVSGWGRIGQVDTYRMSVNLKYAHIGVYPRDICANTPELSGKTMRFTENMICAGAVGKDSCEKDSGGPFVVPMVNSGHGPYRLHGIVSWGPPCHQKLYKGYYTRVQNYVDWIKETINQVENSPQEEN